MKRNYKFWGLVISFLTWQLYLKLLKAAMCLPEFQFGDI